MVSGRVHCDGLPQRFGRYRDGTVTAETLTRIVAAVELRDGGDDSPGRLTGVLMRYGAPGQHGRETFAPGSLRWPANGIRIDHEHASSPARGSVQPPIMRAVPIAVGRWDRSKDRRAATEHTSGARPGDLDAVRSAGVLGAVGGVQSGPPVLHGRAARNHGCHPAGCWSGGYAKSYPDTSVEVRDDTPSRPPMRVYLAMAVDAAGLAAALGISGHG